MLGSVVVYANGININGNPKINPKKERNVATKITPALFESFFWVKKNIINPMHISISANLTTTRDKVSTYSSTYSLNAPNIPTIIPKIKIKSANRSK